MQKKSRRELLAYFQHKGCICILVSFEMFDAVLWERVSTSTRPRSILRSAASFSEVLERQGTEDVQKPERTEADHLFIVRSEENVEPVICEILFLANSVYLRTL